MSPVIPQENEGMGSSHDSGKVRLLTPPSATQAAPLPVSSLVGAKGPGIVPTLTAS